MPACATFTVKVTESPTAVASRTVPLPSGKPEYEKVRTIGPELAAVRLVVE